jgi:NADH:ubiquinone oxidoreductase subunit 5 (subunit L)/multisubunit Na+/H+ antiporter MnhA subunit
MEKFIILIPLFPLITASCLGGLHLFGVIEGEKSERFTARVANYAVGLSCLIALLLLGQDCWFGNKAVLTLGNWLHVDDLVIQISFFTNGFSLKLVVLFALLLCVVMRFSVNYLHREAGFHRFFFVLSLFSFAMFMLVLSANALGTFIGWEIAGLCSYLLIGYLYNSQHATQNATRVFITNRIGDAGFIAGIVLCYLWLGNINWLDIPVFIHQLSAQKLNLIALCFVIAAMVKSAQLPFTPWLARAMEGPTPSSAIFYGAIMIHSGVYLLFLIRPLLELTPLIAGFVAIIGLLTAFYAYIVGLTQTDIKTSLIFATTGQLGLLFLECGLGFWELATWHLFAHIIVRAYQLLTAPSLLHNINSTSIQNSPVFLANNRRFYTYATQRFWLEPMTDWLIVKPVMNLASDLNYVDKQIIDPLMGSPAPTIHAISSLAQAQERNIGAHLDNTEDTFAQGSGLAGKLTQWSANVLHWFEHHFILQGVSENMFHYGRRLGHIANQTELALLKPRYLVTFIFITLLVAM